MRSPVFVMVLALVVLGTAFVALAPDPERMRLESEDGMFVFEVRKGEGELTLERNVLEDIPVYTVGPTRLFDHPARLTMLPGEKDADATIAIWNEETQTWEPLPTSYDESGRFVSETKVTGTFGLISARPSVGSPSREPEEERRVP